MSDVVPAWRVRGALASVLPEGWRLAELYDVWVGGPALAGQVVAADYRIELADDTDPRAVAAAGRQLLAARDLPRLRVKGDRSVPYDLRPLLVDVAVGGPGPRPTLRVRTRLHPTLGTGRPEEVVAALGERVGSSLAVRSIIRERLILADGSG